MFGAVVARALFRVLEPLRVASVLMDVLRTVLVAPLVHQYGYKYALATLLLTVARPAAPLVAAGRWPFPLPVTVVLPPFVRVGAQIRAFLPFRILETLVSFAVAVWRFLKECVSSSAPFTYCL